MISIYTIELLAREREASLLRETEGIRQRRAARGARPRLRAELFSRMGGAFIAAGEWLKTRSIRKTSVDMEPCATCHGNACACS